MRTINIDKLLLRYGQFVTQCCDTLLEILVIYNLKDLIQRSQIKGKKGHQTIEMSLPIETLISKTINKDNEKEFDLFREPNPHLFAQSCVKVLKDKGFEIKLLEDDRIHIKVDDLEIVESLINLIGMRKINKNILGI